MTRYALYFAPPVDSPLWHAGCRWLGRDPASGAEPAQPSIAGAPETLLDELTRVARRYGFHATLKPPFRLAEGFTERQLRDMVQAFAAAQCPIALHDFAVRPLGDFLALRPGNDSEALSALALRCVSHFDLLRAPPSPTELARRRSAGLTARQEALLERWGYPYTEEEFRFHMTLTDTLAGLSRATRQTLRDAAESCFGPALRNSAVEVAALSLYREDVPGAPFTLVRQFPFGASVTEALLPAGGKLYFCVGPSGVGKDSLLQWVEQRMPVSARLVFARRTITRAAHASEKHEAVDADEFSRLAGGGHFAMHWEANGSSYGIRRGIEADLLAGHDVVVNGSREYIPRLRQRFPDAQVIWIEADSGQLRRRIEARQREHGLALAQRLERSTRFTPPADAGDILRIDNNGPIEHAGTQLLRILSRQIGTSRS